MAGRSVRARAWLIAGLALLLMILRIDFWWWGVAMPPVVLGAFNLPMLYQLALFLAGWALVLYTVSVSTGERNQG